jgi:hypothetical protein
MKTMGVSQQLLTILASFLKDGTIRAEVNGHTSPPTAIWASVPQGCVLSPVLFNIMTNDLSHCDTWSSETIIAKYADDVTLVKATTPEDGLADELAYIYNWSVANHLTLNTKKTQVMVIGHNNAKYKLGRGCLDVVDSIKLLGLTLNSQLSWTSQITAVKAKSNKRIHCMKLLRRSGLKCRDMESFFYKACVLPILEYSFSLMTDLHQYEIEEIFSVVKRAGKVGDFKVDLVDVLTRQQTQLTRLILGIFNDTSHPLHSQLVRRRNPRSGTQMFLLPKFKKAATYKCFLFQGLSKFLA